MRCTQSICPVPLWASPSPLFVSKYRFFPTQQAHLSMVGSEEKEKNKKVRKYFFPHMNFKLSNECTCFTGCAT